VTWVSIESTYNYYKLYYQNLIPPWNNSLWTIEKEENFITILDHRRILTTCLFLDLQSNSSLEFLLKKKNVLPNL